MLLSLKKNVSLFSVAVFLVTSLAGFAMFQKPAAAYEPQINLNSVEVHGNYMEGKVLDIKMNVENLAYEKKVYVHYKNNNDNQWYDEEARYIKSADGDYEVWFAEIPFTGDTDEVEYCFKYEVNGQTYWDNDEGQNYITNKAGKTR